MRVGALLWTLRLLDAGLQNRTYRLMAHALNGSDIKDLVKGHSFAIIGNGLYCFARGPDISPNQFDLNRST